MFVTWRADNEYVYSAAVELLGANNPSPSSCQPALCLRQQYTRGVTSASAVIHRSVVQLTESSIRFIAARQSRSLGKTDSTEMFVQDSKPHAA